MSMELDTGQLSIKDKKHAWIKPLLKTKILMLLF